MIRLVALLLLTPIVAWADPRPATVPTRDVDVTYEMLRPNGTGGEQLLTERMRWDVAHGRMRVDPPTTGVYVLLDMQSHRMLAVREAEHDYVDMKSGDATTMPGVGRNAPFHRLGTGTVAGVGCVEWDTRDSSGQPVLVCLTSDGVLLRARDVSHTLIEARRVTYAPAEPGTFDPPSGFQRVIPHPGETP